MVQDPCSRDVLVSDSKCLNCLSKLEKRAIKVWAMAQNLKALGGVDITNVNALLTTVACFDCEPDAVLESIATQLELDDAAAAGATIPTAIADLRAAVKCLVCANPKSLRSAEVYLRCRINNQIG